MNYWIGTSEDDEPATIIGHRMVNVEIAARLKWTTAPTNEGWYWVTYGNGLEVVEVLRDEHGLYIIDGYYLDQRKSVDEQEYHKHWLGPLPVPELPKKESSA